VYQLIKFIVDENQISFYDEAFLCHQFELFLRQPTLDNVKLAKLNGLIVIFLLKLKTFHTNPQVKLKVLHLTVSLCQIFPKA